ncbi:MAG: GAF domain-containing protein [Sedimentisphaerales bacterium]|nr:GAF domain-containing protein [Sedimentisphaerales bacterium]
MKILSLIDGPLDDFLFGQLDSPEISYQKVDYPGPYTTGEVLFDVNFWESLCGYEVDVILIPLRSSDLSYCHDRMNKQHKAEEFSTGAWSMTSAAVVAVLLDDSLDDAVRAAQLDFDGIIAEPFYREHLRQILHCSIKRNQRRGGVERRYHRLQQMFRQVNQDRRRLRSKVDLLCQDLVHSNADLTGTLHEMRRLYDFQNELTGEYDMRYMLYKALRIIREQWKESNAMIYLDGSGEIEAHITGSWCDDQCDLSELEDILQEEYISRVLTTGEALVDPMHSVSGRISAEQRRVISGMAVMAIPIKFEKELLGVLVLYRSREITSRGDELKAIQSYLPPLARAILAVQKVRRFLMH